MNFRFNRETEATNAFQSAPPPQEEAALSALAVEQHHALRDLLVSHGVTVTLARSLATSPDAPFCNNWFSTHPAEGNTPATLVLYPLVLFYPAHLAARSRLPAAPAPLADSEQNPEIDAGADT